jgi:phage I-like protein
MTKPFELITLRANAPQFDASKGEAGLPQRILVLGWGAHETTKGLVICNEVTMKQLAAYNAAQNWDRIAMDFEHNSVPGSPTYAGEPVKIAGYGALQLVAGEGIYLLMSSWTADGKTFAAGGHYGDLSPVVKVNEQNEVIGLHSVALCRHGATPGLVFLSAAPAVQHESATAHPSKSATTMTLEEFSKALAKALGLAETATPEEILAGLTAQLGKAADEAMKPLSAQIATLTKENEALKLLTAANPNADQLKALSTQIAEQGDTLKTLSATLLDSQRGEIIAAAVREGKQVPSIGKTLALDELKKLCAELPVTVPMEKRTPTLEALMLTGGLNTESAEAKAVSAMTGVSDEDRKKYLK